MPAVYQDRMPREPAWLHSPQGVDVDDFIAPDRRFPALHHAPAEGPLVSVIGTVRNERTAFERSWVIWARQYLPKWLEGRVEFHVLDDGSEDHVDDVCNSLQIAGYPVRYSRWRKPGDGPDRSCTLVHNAAIKRLVTAPLVLIQWWDRIPGDWHHLEALMGPHRTTPGIVTSAIGRHIGGSSSCHEMTPEALAGTLAMVPWRERPDLLRRVAGEIGGHCVPGQASESTGLCIPRSEFLALGGYDERYQSRHGYPNVELFRRLMQGGLRVLFPPADLAENFHQSHGGGSEQSRGAKPLGWLADPRVRRNQDHEWGALEPLEVW